jgi:hypothetical protein
MNRSAMPLKPIDSWAMEGACSSEAATGIFGESPRNAQRFCDRDSGPPMARSRSALRIVPRMSPTTAHLEASTAPNDVPSPTASRCCPRDSAVGPLLIVAGAGTGKTSTLAARVAHLVIHGVDPGRILMLTFTRRAALEMRRRVRDIVKAGAGRDLVSGISQSLLQRMQWAGTFHAIGSRLLRHYAQAPEPRPEFHDPRPGRCRRPDRLDPRAARLRRSSTSASRARTSASRSIRTASTPRAR